MKQEVKIGQTDYTVLVLMRDSTTGLAKPSLVFNSAGIDVSYTRVETDNDVVNTVAAVADLASPALTDSHLDWGFLLVSDTEAPGLYRFDIADGVFAAGAWSAVVSLRCTGCDTVHLEFVLVPESPSLGVKVTALAADVITPASVDEDANFIVQAVSITNALDAGSVLVDGTTTLTGNVSFAGTFDVVGALTAGSVSIDAGLDVVGALSANSLLVDTTTTLTGNVSCAGTFDVVGALSAGSVLVDATTALTGAVTAPAGITANITGDLSGSVGSLTGHTNQTADNDTLLTAIDGYLDTEIAAIISLLDDARTEPAQGDPPVNPDAMTKLDWLYKFMRNKIMTSATQISVYNDAGDTVDHKSTIGDDGTDFTRGEFATGP